MSEFYEGGAADNPTARRSWPRVGLALRSFIVCVAYYFCTLLGYALIFPSSYISIIWPPNTILLVALLLSPRWQWLWLLLIPLPVHLWVQSQFGVSLWIASLYYAFNCCVVPLTAEVLRRVGGGDLALNSLRQALLFITGTTIAVAVATLVWSPLIASLWFDGDLWSQWTLTFMSNYLPFLIATPALVMALRHGPDIIRSASLARCGEFALLTLGLLACAIGVFGLAPRAIETVPALFYAPLPFLLWAAVRFGSSGLSFAFLIFTLMAILDAIAGYGPFITQSAEDSVFRMQIFLLALYTPLLVLASVVEERRRAFAALSESEQEVRRQYAQLATIYDAAPVGLAFVDTQLRYMVVNDCLAEIHGVPTEAHLGRHVREVLPHLADTIEPIYRQVLETGEPVVDVEFRDPTLRRSRMELTWLVSRYPVKDARGALLGVITVAQETTQRKQIEEVRQELAHAARLAIVGELTASIAHEINQPLGAILSNADAAELLLESSPAPLVEIRQILDDIRRDDLRASEVIRRLRALLHKREMEVQRVDLNEMIQEVFRLVRAEAGRRGVVVEADGAAGLPPVRGDKVHLQQVLLNLLLNGMEAMAESPGAKCVTVRCSVGENGSVEVAVSDAGPGIAPDRLHRLFDPFFSTKKEGMGLGLSIARTLVEAHGGRVWAENNTDGGATFRFTVPTGPVRLAGESSEPTS